MHDWEKERWWKGIKWSITAQVTRACLNHEKKILSENRQEGQTLPKIMIRLEKAWVWWRLETLYLPEKEIDFSENKGPKLADYEHIHPFYTISFVMEFVCFLTFHLLVKYCRYTNVSTHANRRGQHWSAWINVYNLWHCFNNNFKKVWNQRKKKKNKLKRA